MYNNYCPYKYKYELVNWAYKRFNNHDEHIANKSIHTYPYVIEVDDDGLVADCQLCKKTKSFFNKKSKKQLYAIYYNAK